MCRGSGLSSPRSTRLTMSVSTSLAPGDQREVGRNRLRSWGFFARGAGKAAQVRNRPKPDRGDDRDPSANHVGNQFLQSIGLASHPVILDTDVFALDEPDLFPTHPFRDCISY
jgi:hypothetical protein